MASFCSPNELFYFILLCFLLRKLEVMPLVSQDCGQSIGSECAHIPASHPGVRIGVGWEVEMVGSLTAAFPDYLEPRKPPEGESGRQALQTSFHLSAVLSGQSVLIFVFLTRVQMVLSVLLTFFCNTTKAWSGSSLCASF